MLVLTRKTLEWIDVIIPAELTRDGQPLVAQVGVVEIKGGRVRLGCEGPRAVKFARHEVSAGFIEEAAAHV